MPSWAWLSLFAQLRARVQRLRAGYVQLLRLVVHDALQRFRCAVGCYYPACATAFDEVVAWRWMGRCACGHQSVPQRAVRGMGHSRHPWVGMEGNVANATFLVKWQTLLFVGK